MKSKKKKPKEPDYHFEETSVTTATATINLLLGVYKVFLNQSLMLMSYSNAHWSFSQQNH